MKAGLRERLDRSAKPVSGFNTSWLTDPFRQWAISLLLLVLVVASALGVIYSSYQSRQLFSELENLKRESIRLEEEWGRLLLEQSTWAAHSRIERMARSELKMVVPDQRNIIVVGQ